MRIREVDRECGFDRAQVTFTDDVGREHCYTVCGKVYLKIMAYWIDDVWQESEIGQQLCERMGDYGNTLMNSGGVAATLRREWAKCRRELRKENKNGNGNLRQAD